MCCILIMLVRRSDVKPTNRAVAQMGQASRASVLVNATRKIYVTSFLRRTANCAKSGSGWKSFSGR